MFDVASFRYRNVLSANGGPIAGLLCSEQAVFGRKMYQVNARLEPGLVAGAGHILYGDADGSGTNPVAEVARNMAVSEALERWAFHATVRSSRAAEFGFDVDPSSNGMSAFPGLRARRARRHAMLEAIERYSVVAWWEGCAGARQFSTDWPGVSAIAIDGPLGGVAVIAYARTEFGMHVYGYGAEESFGAACERAVTELARNAEVLRAWWLSFIAGDARQPSNRFERRLLYFASDAGHEQFLEHVRRQGSSRSPQARVACDRELMGPWSEYTTVWRFVLVPLSNNYLYAGDDYFFW